MKKILSLFFVAFFSVSLFADITVGAKVPNTWASETISVYVYGTDLAIGPIAATKDGDWWTYTYTGSVSPINVIFINGTGWSSDKNKTEDITNISADSYYELAANGENMCTATWKAGYIGIHANFNGDKGQESNWETRAFTIAADKQTASYTCNLAHGYWLYFGMRIGASSNWTSNGVEFTRGASSKVITAGEGQCLIKIDKAGEYTFTWTYATNTLTITWPDLVLENGWYLVGKFNNVDAWDYSALSAEKKFTLNSGSEYKVTATLLDGDRFKAAYVYGDVIDNYKPSEESSYHSVDANHAGVNKTIYFEEEKQEKWGNWYFYVPDNGGGTAIDETIDSKKAVKRIVNGQLVIEREGKMYNALGAEVK